MYVDKYGSVQELRSNFIQIYFCFSRLMSLALNKKVCFGYWLNYGHLWCKIVKIGLGSSLVWFGLAKFDLV